MNCGIMQPSYIPWRGAFDLIRRVDVYVFFDDVQYTKKSWRNRNRIKTPRGVRWLTIPVHARGSITDHTPIHEIRIDHEQRWNVSHREKLHQSYRAAPHYDSHATLLDQLYADPPRLLADYTIATTVQLARALGIAHTRFLRSSELGIEGHGTERVLGVLRRLGADRLINGPTARDYTDHELLDRAGIEVEYMRYDYPSYPQLHGAFESHVSVIDLMVMVGTDAPRYIWG